jgi:hypothetical protein
MTWRACYVRLHPLAAAAAAAGYSEDGAAGGVGSRELSGRDFHSSTSELNLSRFRHLNDVISHRKCSGQANRCKSV